jgi:hypothetical protein
LIGPDVRQARKGRACRLKHALATLAVGDAGGMDHHAEEEAVSVDEDVPFAADQLFVPIIAAQPTHQGLHRLAIDTCSAGRGISAGMPPRQLAQLGMDLDPGPIATPLAKIGISSLYAND